MRGFTRSIRALFALGMLWTVVLCSCRSAGPHRTPVASAPDTPAEALAAYGRGLQHDFAGDPRKALAEYLVAIHADPGRSPAYLRALAAHGALRRRGGEESGLLDALAAVAGEHPREIEPLRWIARLHAADDRPGDANAAYARALRHAPADPGLHAERLAQCLRIQPAPDLGAAFREALRHRVDPALLVAPAGEWLLRARQEEDSTGIRDALHVLAQVQGRALDQPQVLLLLGQVYRQASQKDLAHAALAHARRATPDLPEVYLHDALFRLAQEDFSAARRILAEGVAAVHQPLELLRLLAEAATEDAIRLAGRGDEPAAAEAREEAIGAVRRLIASLPGDTRLRLRLGDLLILSGRTEEAVRELGRVPHADADLQQAIARRLLSVGAFEEALPLLRGLAAEQPGNAALHHLLGEVLHEIGRREEALDVLLRATGMDSPPAAVFLRRALILAESDELENAIGGLEDGLRATRGDPAILELAAVLCLEAGRPAEALVWLDRLRDSETASPSILHSLYRGVALHYAGRTGEAVQRLATDIADDRTLAERFTFLAARIDARLGDRAGTRETFRLLAEALPGEPAIPLAAGLYEHIAGAHADALPFFEAARTAAADHPEGDAFLTAAFFFAFGAASERAGEAGQAMELLAEAIRLDPEHADALNYLAYLWAERSLHLDEAERLVLKALEHDPESAPYIDTLGWIYFRQGRYEEALHELKRALDRMPDDPTISDHVGDALHALGRTPVALRHWLHALEHDPENPGEIREKLRTHGVDIPSPADGESNGTPSAPQAAPGSGGNGLPGESSEENRP